MKPLEWNCTKGAAQAVTEWRVGSEGSKGRDSLLGREERLRECTAVCRWEGGAKKAFWKRQRKALLF